ncbi:MAG: diacylglycerol kinase family lipid kinase, partial [Aldersonia sp.]|nr:diacylglycerol kinase family lipid kinase [Aldersonia sp.]
AGVRIQRIDEATLRDLLARHGLGDELIATASEDDARAQTRDAVTQGYEIVVAAGGDGTVGLVAGELLDTQVALGILPLGSLMNIPRSLDIPRDLEAAAAIIGQGETHAVDIGEANGRAFYECGSVGLNAALFAEAQHFGKGRYQAVLSALRVMVRYRPTRMWLEMDDRTVKTRALMVTVANGPYTGFGFTFAPNARLDDGRFDVRVFGGFSRWELIRHVASIAAGRRRYHAKVTTYRSARVVVRAKRPLPVRADSDDLGTTPTTFVTRRAALHVRVPAGVQTVDDRRD